MFTGMIIVNNRSLIIIINTLVSALLIHITCISLINSKLVQEGLTHHEISERVKDKAMNESESIYGTLYGTLEGQDEE